MKSSEKGNILIIAAVIGIVAATATFLAYNAFNDGSNDSGNGGSLEQTQREQKEIAPKIATTTQESTEEKEELPEASNKAEALQPENGTDAPETETELTTASESPLEFKQYAISADPAEAVTAVNVFNFNLYSKYKSETEKNVFFSPYSIYSALGMTYEGSRGQTAKEMRSLFGFPADDQIRVGTFAKLKSQINQPTTAYQLSSADALWAQSDYPFAPGYIKTIETYYGGKASNVDFKKDAEISRQTINSWVSAKTNDKIPELFAKGSLNEYTRLVLTNAVYFKGNWAEPFEKLFTQEREFLTASGSKVRVQTMNKTEGMGYLENQNYQAVEMPYQNGDVSMLVILPKIGKMEATEAALTTSGIAATKQAMEWKQVNIFLPRFKYSSSYDMGKTLTEMGMSTAFDPKKADFSGMYDRNAANGENLYIALVIHKAYIDVNEEGTEAAAATGVSFGATSAIMETEEPKIFRADRPFIFAIVHNETGAILFMGKVNDPTK